MHSHHFIEPEQQSLHCCFSLLCECSNLLHGEKTGGGKKLVRVGPGQRSLLLRFFRFGLDIVTWHCAQVHLALPCVGLVLFISTNIFVVVLFVYLVTPPKMTAPRTNPLQPTNQRPTTRSVAVLGIDTVITVPLLVATVVFPLLSDHCVKGLTCKNIYI